MENDIEYLQKIYESMQATDEIHEGDLIKSLDIDFDKYNFDDEIKFKLNAYKDNFYLLVLSIEGEKYSKDINNKLAVDFNNPQIRLKVRPVLLINGEIKKFPIYMPDRYQDYNPKLMTKIGNFENDKGEIKQIFKFDNKF